MMSFQPRSRTPRTRSSVRDDSEAAADEQAPADERAGRKHGQLRPGWSSSSLELLDGLDVTEQVPLDELPPEWADRLSRR